MRLPVLVRGSNQAMPSRSPSLVASAFVACSLFGCGGAKEAAPEPELVADPAVLPSGAPGIDSPALAMPPASSAKPDAGGVIKKITCKEGEADTTCSERASREALRGAPEGSRVLGVTVGAEASAYRAALEIDGVVQMIEVGSPDEVAAQAKELASQGHRVTVKSVEAVSGAKRERRAVVLLKLASS